MTAIHVLLIVSSLVSADGADPTREKAIELEDYTPCGLTSLYLVCQLRELPVTWDQVKSLVGPAGPGGDLAFADLAAAATKLGMHPVGVQAGRKALDDMPMPAVVQVHDAGHPKETAHFLVLLRTEADGVWLLDAPYPAYFLPDSRFRLAWTGNVLLFAQDEHEAMRLRELAHGRETSGWLVWAAVISLASALTGWGFVKLVCHVGNTIKARTSRPRLWSGASWTGLRRAMVAGLLLAVVLGLSLIVGLGNAAPPRCEFDQPVLDLGELPLGPHSLRVPITNSGGQVLNIAEIASTCTCAVVKAPAAIEPGQTADLDVELRVTPGPRSAELRIHSNDLSGTKHVAISWQGKVRPILIPRWVASSHVAMDQTYEKTVRVAYPGGKSAVVPRLERFESDDARVELSAGKNNPTAVKFASAGILTNILGELELKLTVKPPKSPGTVSTLAKITLKYGETSEVLNLPISIGFVGGSFGPDASAVTFAGTEDAGLYAQERVARVRGAATRDEIEVSSVPEWLSCRVEQGGEDGCVLRLQVKKLSSSSFLQHEISIGRKNDARTRMPVRVTVLAPEQKR